MISVGAEAPQYTADNDAQVAAGIGVAVRATPKRTMVLCKRGVDTQKQRNVWD